MARHLNSGELQRYLLPPNCMISGTGGPFSCSRAGNWLIVGN
jgi:hypothetical protein